MGTGSKYVGSAVYVALLLVACGGDSDDADDGGGSDTGATSSTTGSTSGATTSATGDAATSSSSGGTSTNTNSISTTTATTAGSATTGTTGGDDPWVCLEVSSGCLCSKVPGSEGETGPCAANYDCCYGLEGSTCYCIETPAENCNELIAVGYTRYESCPPL